MPTLIETKRELSKHRDPVRAAFLQRFFKTGKGEYAENDKFMGMPVPVIRAVSKRFKDLSLADLGKLMKSPLHEERMLALFILVHQFSKGDGALQKRIAELYLKSVAKYVNNWDLVDTSAPYIAGPYLLDRPRKILFKMAKSRNLWERRVAIITTQHFIRNDDFMDTLRIAEILMNDGHDLIHKAVGWMLREVGNRDITVEREFLDQHATRMPRTMLRYAIEKFPEQLRLKYLRMTE